MAGFISGSQLWTEGEPALFYTKAFTNANELFAYDLRSLYDLVQELELHTDVNFTIVRISYLADVGLGRPTLQLLVAEREPIARGVGFEIEERGLISQSLSNLTLKLSDKAKSAHQYYSTGLTLLALEDQVSGLIDAAYMQFYLAVEAILEAYTDQKAVEKGKRLYATKFTPNIEAAVVRVFAVRNSYFGHAGAARRRGMLTDASTFAVAAQTLVARWCARSLIELEVGNLLVHREMRFYSGNTQSVTFDGDAAQLDTELALTA
jgi:hypothetical protein